MADNVFNRIGKFFKPVNKKISASDLNVQMIRPGGDIFDRRLLNLPISPFSSRELYNMSYASDILTTVQTALRNEIFRNGFNVMATKDTASEVADPDELPDPDPEGRKKILEFSVNVNDNDQSLLDVCKELEDDINILDTAYGLFVFDYLGAAKDEDVEKLELKEFLRISPIGMQVLMNRQGIPGFDDQGVELLFHPLKRDNLIQGDPGNIPGLLRAYYCHTSGQDRIYYAKHEMVRLVKYRPSVGYSPVLTVWQKVLTLIKQDEFMLEMYAGKRSPKQILAFMTQNKEQLKQDWYDGAERVRDNPHLPMIMAVSPQAGSGSAKFAEVINLMDNLEELKFIEQSESYRRHIGSVFHVSPLFQNDVSQSGGLNNEGLQITVTNRGVEIGQEVYNGKLFPRYVQALGVEGWTVLLNPSEEEDEMSELERQELSLSNASKAANMGLDVEWDSNQDTVIIESGSVEPMSFGFDEDATGDEPNGKDDEDDDNVPPLNPDTDKVMKAKIENVPDFVEKISNDVASDLVRLLNRTRKLATGKISITKVEAGDVARIEKIADDAMAEFNRRGDSIMRGRSQEVAVGTVGWLLSKFSDLGVRETFDQGDVAALAFFQKSQLDRIKGITDDMRNKISNQLNLGVLNGESERQIANRIGKVMSASKSRLRTIARTETKRVFDDMALERYKEAGVEKVEWITARDDRVRPNHAQLEGSSWKTDSGRIPRDVLAEPNCRCILLPLEESDTE